MYNRFLIEYKYWLNRYEGSLFTRLKKINKRPGIKLMLLHKFINDTPNFLFLFKIIAKFIYRRLNIKYCSDIPLKAKLGHFIKIFHPQGIIINSNVEIGFNVTIMQQVTVGVDVGKNKSPVIADNVFIGAGAKIIGDIFIAEGIKIGANAVVVKSAYDKNMTLVGIPAKEIKGKK